MEKLVQRSVSQRGDNVVYKGRMGGRLLKVLFQKGKDLGEFQSLFALNDLVLEVLFESFFDIVIQILIVQRVNLVFRRLKTESFFLLNVLS